MSTVTEPLGIPWSAIATRARDYAELTKMRVTSMIMVTAGCGYYFGCLKSDAPLLSLGLLQSLLGIGLAAGGTAALNEAMEHDVDGRMRRTARRPVPTGRISVWHAALVGALMSVGGFVYLALAQNPLTGWLSLATTAVYLAVYTPLKKVHPICTFVGAFPGAMPGVLGWTAARGDVECGALVMFAIVFFWQFPHFFSIAWLYREDYEAGHIRMLPVVEPDGKSTLLRILLYSLALIPVSLAPTLLDMAGWIYFVGALFLGIALLCFAVRLAALGLPLQSTFSKQRARQLLQATVFYLPILFALMILDTASS
jgi:protoheme IX farnesyltransferase